MGSSRSRDASPPFSPPVRRPGTAAPPGSWCGSGAAGPVGSQTAMLAGGGGASAATYRPAKLGSSLDQRPRAAPAPGHALREASSLSPGQAPASTQAPGTWTQALAPPPAPALVQPSRDSGSFPGRKGHVLKQHRRSERSCWTEHSSPPTQRFPGELLSESV